MSELSPNYGKYDEDQKEEIQKGLLSGVDVSIYDKPEFLAIQMQQIRLGLEAGIDVSSYADSKYDWYQMEEIRKGIVEGIDISKYANPHIGHQSMRIVRNGLKSGIDVSKLIDYPANVLEQFAIAVSENIDIAPFVKSGYDASQLEQIRLSKKSEIDIVPYINKEMRGIAIREIRIGLEEGLDVESYARIDFSWRQMREIRLGLEKKVDTSIYINPLYIWDQMREIRLGLESGIDVSKYKSFVNTAKEMRKKREKLIKEAIRDKRLKSGVLEKLILKKGEILTENVIVTGDVIIYGNLASGVEINAGGDITIYNTLGRAKLNCKGNLTLKEGVKGNKNCFIDVKGNVYGKFFESANIRVGGNLTTENLLNCNVDADGFVEIKGERGAIIGGDVRGERGITAYNIGNKMMKKTRIEVGKAGVSRTDLSALNKRIRNIEAEINMMETSIKKYNKTNRKEDLMEMDIYIKLLTFTEQKQEELKDLYIKRDILEESIKNDIKAEIRVLGTIFQGVEVVVSGEIWEASQRSNVIMTLSKNHNVSVTKG